ncbi:MAG: uridine kinase [Caldisericaceae bacterium]
MKPTFIGIAGGTGSGKTTVAQIIRKNFKDTETAIISMDSYYKDFQNLTLDERKKLNYDHPSIFDFELLCSHLAELRKGNSIKVPIYSFEKYERTGQFEVVHPRPIIIVEGILLFYYDELRSFFSIKIFVDADADVRIIRRIKRDVQKRGRSLDSVIDQYLNTVRPMHIQFVEPTKQFADIIIPRGGKNEIAMDIIVAKIKSILRTSSKPS